MNVSPLLPVSVLLGGLSLTVLANFLSTRHQRKIASRMDQIAGQPGAASAEAEVTGRPRVTFVHTLRDWLTAQSMTERVQHDLDGAGISLRAEEFIAIVAASTVVLPLLAWLVTANPVLAVFMVLLGYLSPWRVVRFARARRKLRLEVQLADALTLIAAALRSGHTAVQSMEVATQQLPPPIAEEFSRVIFNANIGMPISEALQQMADRIHSYEYDMMVSALTIQLEVGGSITGLLESIANTIRDRATLRDEMRALTSQGRLSAMILSAMPVGLFLLASLTTPTYAQLLLTDPLGQALVKVAVGMETIGWLIMRRMLNVRV